MATKKNASASQVQKQIKAKRARIARAKILKAERIEADRVRVTAELEIQGDPPPEVAAQINLGDAAFAGPPLEMDFDDPDRATGDSLKENYTPPAKRGFWEWLLGSGD
jgi:hypothetical protein